MKFNLIYLLVLVFLLVLNGKTTILASVPEQVNLGAGYHNSTINCIINGADGFLWVGSQNGLIRHDGYNSRFYRYSLSDSSSLLGNIVNQIKVDKNRHLWIATDLGLNVYNRKDDSFYRFPLKGLDGENYFTDVYDIEFSPDNEVFILSNEQLFFYPKVANPSDFVFIASDFNNIQLTGGRDLYVDGLKNVWIATDGNGIVILNKDLEPVSGQFYDQIKKYMKGFQLTRIFEDSKNRLWIGTIKHGVVRVDLEGSEIKTYSFTDVEEELKPSVFDITENKNQELLFSTSNGLLTFCEKNERLKSYSSSNLSLSKKELVDLEFRTAYFDSLDIGWFGSYYGGLFKSVPASLNTGFVAFNIQDYFRGNLSGFPVLSFYEDSGFRLWIGTDKKGLWYFNRGENSIFKEKVRVPIDVETINALYSPDSLHLWMGTFDKGLIILDKQTMKKVPLPPALDKCRALKRARILSFYQDTQSRVWISTNGNGLILYDPKSERTRIIKSDEVETDTHQILTSNIIKVLEDLNGNFWVGTYYGLYVLSPEFQVLEKFFYSDKNNSIGHNWIYDLEMDSIGNIWIATANGLSRYSVDKDLFQLINISSEGNTFFSLQSDQQGNIWASTDKGINRIHTVSLRVKNFDVSDGLHENVFNKGASFRNEKGDIFFGGPNGYTKFNPANIHCRLVVPRVFFEKIIFQGFVNQGPESGLERIIIGKEKVTVPYSKNFFSLDFSVVSFLNHEKIKIAYLVEGLTDEWIEATDTRIAFTGLPPGKYRLIVRAGEDLFHSEFAQSSMEIEVLRPWWGSWLAYVFYCLIFIFGSFLFMFYAKTLSRQKNQLYLLQLEKENQEKLNQARIRMVTNISHELKTPLTLIINAARKLAMVNFEKLLPELILRNGKKLLVTVNQLMDIHKLEEGLMEFCPGKVNLSVFIQTVAEPFIAEAKERNIQFVFLNYLGDQSIDIDSDKVEKIVSNLLSNAFKFTQKGEVKIKLFKSDDQREPKCCIEVSDTGCGMSAEQIERVFDRYYTAGHSNNSGTGIGLSLALQLARIHQGEISVNSVVGEGSRFLFAFNVSTNSYHQETGQQMNLYQPDGLEAGSRLLLEDGRFLPLVLVVDDSWEMRRFISDVFLEKFRILEAENGEVAFDMALKFMPDAIVCDVMMPVMDGLEMTKRIRSDVRVRHIPVVLLTALHGEPEKVKCLSAGASDFIEKPFNAEVLFFKVRNILQLTKLQRLDNRVSKGELKDDYSDNRKELDFLTSLLLFIQEHISDPQFEVSQIIQHFGLSRSVFYRKVKRLTNENVNELIRDVRLKQALELLKEGKLSVAEIAFEVGYKDTGYFIKLFRQRYGCTPGDLKNTK